MYFVSGKFKNIAASIDKMVLKKEQKGIKDNDIITLFDDGWCVHKKTNSQILTASLPAHSEKEMRDRAKSFFKKAGSITYKANTQSQFEQENIKAKTKRQKININ